MSRSKKKNKNPPRASPESQPVTRSWFAVLNNPADHGYTGDSQEVCNRLRDEWIEGGEHRTGRMGLLYQRGRTASCTHGSGR